MIVCNHVLSLAMLLLVATIKGQEIDFDDSTCGRQKVSLGGLIKAGWRTRAGEFPWHVAMFHRVGNSTEFDYQCGGSIVHKYLILTAAHCVTLPSSRKHKDRADILIKVGRFNISEEQEEQGRDHEVAQVITHQNYDPLVHANDIAMLKLSVPVIFTQFVQPVCLWKRDDGVALPDFHGQLGTVVGWGLADDNNPSSILNIAKMPVVSTYDCLQSDRVFFLRLLNANMFCAGFKNGTGVCNGDSGGGMVFERHGQWYLRGVVSYSDTVDARKVCNLKQYVGFTDVGQYLEWIYENAPGHENSDPVLGHPNIRLINHKTCGTNHYEFDYEENKKNIFMGYPWMVILRHPFDNPEKVSCNGVLINKNYVLTTDCVDWNDDVQVALGEYNTVLVSDCEAWRNTTACASPIQIKEVSEFYRKDQLILARLSTPANVNHQFHIQAICLSATPEQRQEVYSNYILTGWKGSGNASQYLQRGIVDFISQESCRNEISSLEKGTEEEKIITDFKICVRNMNDPNRIPPCNDYQPGAALQAIDKTSNKYLLYGIQTGVSNCSRPETFIALPKYLEWILDNIRL